MGNFARYVSSNVYIVVSNVISWNYLEEWFMRNGRDLYLGLDGPFEDTNVFVIKSNSRYNMRRIASQIGNVLAKSKHREPLIARERK